MENLTRSMKCWKNLRVLKSEKLINLKTVRAKKKFINCIIIAVNERKINVEGVNVNLEFSWRIFLDEILDNLFFFYLSEIFS